MIVLVFATLVNRTRNDWRLWVTVDLRDRGCGCACKAERAVPLRLQDGGRGGRDCGSAVSSASPCCRHLSRMMHVFAAPYNRHCGGSFENISCNAGRAQAFSGWIRRTKQHFTLPDPGHSPQGLLSCRGTRVWSKRQMAPHTHARTYTRLRFRSRSKERSYLQRPTETLRPPLPLLRPRTAPASVRHPRRRHLLLLLPQSTRMISRRHRTCAGKTLA